MALHPFEIFIQGLLDAGHSISLKKNGKFIEVSLEKEKYIIVSGGINLTQVGEFGILNSVKNAYDYTFAEEIPERKVRYETNE